MHAMTVPALSSTKLESSKSQVLRAIYHSGVGRKSCQYWPQLIVFEARKEYLGKYNGVLGAEIDPCAIPLP